MHNSPRITYFVSALISCFFLSWILLASQAFFYPAIYEGADFQHHILRYAPQNRFKPNFALTTPAEHKRMFAAINHAVHLAPQELDNITYQTINSAEPQKLLHIREIQHLQDVAGFIRHLYVTGAISLLLWFISIVLMKTKQIRIASGRLMLLCTGVLTGLCAGVLLMFGPTKVFYWLHTLIFPKNHAWFFYYQDSLMSTLMKAPDLFAYIGIELVLLGGVLFTAQYFMLRRFLNGPY